MTFSRASNYTSLDRKQTMQTFSLQRHCGKINVFLAKGGFGAIYSTFASKTCRTAWHCFTTQRSKNAPPWKLTNVEWFQAIKFAYRECKGKNTTNLPTHETTYLLKYEKATLWHSFKAKKTKVCFVSSERQYKKTCHLSLMQHAGHREIYNCLLFFVNGTVF